MFDVGHQTVSLLFIEPDYQTKSYWWFELSHTKTIPYPNLIAMKKKTCYDFKTIDAFHFDHI